MGMMSEEERGAGAPKEAAGASKEAAGENKKPEEKDSGLKEGTRMSEELRPRTVVVNTKPAGKEDGQVQEEKAAEEILNHNAKHTAYLVKKSKEEAGIPKATDKEGLLAMEENAAEAYEDYEKKYKRMLDACEQERQAEEDYMQVLMDLAEGLPDESNQRVNQAADKRRAAKEKAAKAKQSMGISQAAALAASAAMETQKMVLTNTRDESMDFVVHMARIQCTYGMRESMAVLKMDHGVMSGGQSQMTVADTDPAINFVNFGGCTSPENETVRAEAQKAMETALEASGKTWADSVVDTFTKGSSKELKDEIVNQCIGECLLKFPPGVLWEKGHEKVKIQGDALLMRRCELTCAYGGLVTILLSGQMG